MMKPGTGHVQKAIRRAFRARPGCALTTRELLAWSHPRGAGRPLRDRRNHCRAIRGAASRKCASALAESGPTACCGNGLILALRYGAEYGQELLRRKLLWELNVERRMMSSATRPLLIYLAGVLFPEGAVA